MSQEQGFVARFYTAARKHALVVGRLDKSFRLPGGPYTLAQIGVFIGAFLGMFATRDLWAHLPGLANLLVMVTVPYGLAWAMRRARIEGRTPLAVARGVINCYTSTTSGRLHGRPWRWPEPHIVRGRIWIHAPELAADRPPPVDPAEAASTVQPAAPPTDMPIAEPAPVPVAPPAAPAATTLEQLVTAAQGPR